MRVSSRRLLSLGMVVLVLCSLASAVYAGPPPIPHSFYGTLTINGQNAPVGTVVAARVGGAAAGSYTTTVVGRYGDRPNASYLAVASNINAGDTINFYVNGVDTTQTAAFEPGGGPTELNLSIGPARGSSIATASGSGQTPPTGEGSR